MFKRPFLAKCWNRSSLPKTHPISWSPEEWLDNESLESKGLFGISFDFFVDWSQSPPVLCPKIWIKVILEPNFSYTDILEDINRIFIEEFGIDYLNRLSSFASNSKLEVQFIIFNDELDWENKSNKILIIDFFKVNDDFNFKGSLVNIDEFRVNIQNNSWGPVKIGTKWLIYGTSKLECYLSHTDSLYPWDVDLLIIDNLNKPKWLLELKKHTLDSDISLQCLSNYYPMPDWRKYNRLAILRDYMNSQGNNVAFLVLYYPTNEIFTEGRLELINGRPGNLKKIFASNFALPTKNNFSDYEWIVSKLDKAIKFNEL